ncbi:MAG: hypothetical protein GEU86_20480 [Actinophytocola sp.]|nr:hypothetical protein [Actinophytocola sp.]
MTDRSYSPDEIRGVARKIGGLSGDLSATGSGITAKPGGDAFGKLPSSGSIAEALSSFTQAMRQELSAGAKLMTATETSITAAADGMDATEEDSARSFSSQQPA